MKRGRHHKSNVKKINAAKHEPAPKSNSNSTIVLDLVIADVKEGNINIAGDIVSGILLDLQKRSGEGFKKYGTLLCTDNGRDSLMDFYQEILDAVVYIRQFNAEYPDEVFSQHLYEMLWDIAGVTWDEIYK